jgi:hypothetical protein
MDHKESPEKFFENIIKNQKGNLPQMESSRKLKVKALGYTL